MLSNTLRLIVTIHTSMTYTTKTWNPVETHTQTSTSTMTEEPWADSVADTVHEDPTAHLKIQVQRPGL